MDIAKTPQPPYYAVIFTAKTKDLTSEYSTLAKELQELAKEQEGYLGFENAEGEIEISISYWDSLESIHNWKSNTLHRKAQKKGKAEWYDSYTVRIVKVEQEYSI